MSKGQCPKGYNYPWFGCTRRLDIEGKNRRREMDANHFVPTIPPFYFREERNVVL